jgi:hypothetical protein
MRKNSGEQEGDYRDLRVNIVERRVTAACHNGWRFVTGRKSTPLEQTKGVYTSDAVITIKDYIPHDLIAIVFELVFKVNI